VQLSLKKAILSQLDALLVETVEKGFESKNLISLIEKVVALEANPASKQVQVSEKDFSALAAQLKTQLQKSLKEGLEIRPIASVASGFRLAEKDGSGFYDFSAEETAALLKPFLSPAIAEIVFGQAK
jgi:V/A-type H+-transporting ATPase subunit E